MVIDTVTANNLTAIAAAASVIAAGFAWRSWYLKSGVRIRGMHSVHSTVECDDKYVGSVTLENLQDRAAVIFKIFLHVGHSYFIEVDDCSDSPLVLQPFETIHREYSPIQHYVSGSGGRIDMNQLLDNPRVRKRLVLSTPDGRYRVRYTMKYWDPVLLFFRNYMTGVVHAQRTVVAGETYGSNVKYVVKLVLADGRIEWVRFRADENRLRVFRRFDLTPEALSTAASLEQFLLERAVAGELVCQDIEVYDLDRWRAEVYELELRRPPFVAPQVSRLQYAALGRAATWLEQRRMRTANLESRKAEQQRRATEHVDDGAAD